MLSLKKSIYNIQIEKLDNNDILLYNTFSSAFGILHNDNLELYNNIENLTVMPEDLQARGTLEVLLDNGFIVEKEIDEYQRLYLMGNKERFNSSTLSLTIAPTLNCNMACPYCYENKNNETMNEDTIKAIIQFTDKLIKKECYKYLSVVWYGGEPLLYKDIIYRISDEFIELSKIHKITYVSSIVTNGTLLDYDTARILKDKYNLMYAQITVDGLKETNNKRRILKNGEDSFNIILNNIESCHKILRILIRINIDANNISDIKPLIKYLLVDRNLQNNVKIYFAPISKQTEICNVNEENCFNSKTFGDINSELNSYLIQYYKEINEISLPYPYPMVLGCTALATNTFVIDPSGILYKCWDEIGCIEKNVGNVFEGIRLNKQMIDWCTFEMPETCKKCELAPLCQSSCPYQRMKNNKIDCHYRTVSFINDLKNYYTCISKARNISING
jgi:uncharacterized protein